MPRAANVTEPNIRPLRFKNMTKLGGQPITRDLTISEASTKF